MAFNQQSNREAVNRKILEDLQLKKQMLLKQGVAQSLQSTSVSVPSTFTSSPGTSDGTNLNSMQRSALLNAHSTSTGFFITTDSSFGNIILPVLPRHYPESSDEPQKS